MTATFPRVTSRRVRYSAAAVALAVGITSWAVIGHASSAHADIPVTIPSGNGLTATTATVTGDPVTVKGLAGTCPTNPTGPATLSGPLTVTITVPDGAIAVDVQLGGFGPHQVAFASYIPVTGPTTEVVVIPATGGGTTTPIASLHCNSLNGTELPLYVVDYSDTGHNLGSVNITPTQVD